MKKFLNIITMLPLFILLTACVEGEVKPSDPLWEREGCARCRMVISEKRFAVQRIFPNGEVHFYDDIVCAMKHGHDHNEGKLYVRPHDGNDWVPAEKATFESGLRTPMNSGFGAVKSDGPVSFQEILEKYKD